MSLNIRLDEIGGMGKGAAIKRTAASKVLSPLLNSLRHSESGRYSRLGPILGMTKQHPYFDFVDRVNEAVQREGIKSKEESNGQLNEEMGEDEEESDEGEGEIEELRFDEEVAIWLLCCALASS